MLCSVLQGEAIGIELGYMQSIVEALLERERMPASSPSTSPSLIHVDADVPVAAAVPVRRCRGSCACGSESDSIPAEIPVTAATPSAPTTPSSNVDHEPAVPTTRLHTMLTALKADMSAIPFSVSP